MGEVNVSAFTFTIGLLFAFGFTGLIWVSLSYFSKLSSDKIAGFAIATGMTLSFSYLIFEKGDYNNFLIVLVTLGVIIYSYFAASSAVRDHIKKEDSKNLNSDNASARKNKD